MMTIWDRHHTEKTDVVEREEYLSRAKTTSFQQKKNRTLNAKLNGAKYPSWMVSSTSAAFTDNQTVVQMHLNNYETHYESCTTTNHRNI